MDDYLKTVERRLKRFSPPEAQALGAWLKDKPVGINLALQFLEQVSDLKAKTGKDAAALLAELLDEVSAKDLTSKELGRRLRDAADRRLHPQRHAHESAFEVWQKGLSLPSGVRVQPPQNFEGKIFTLRVEFSDAEGLHRILERLSESLRTVEAWKELGRF
ncbi:MAG: hypothetical protein IT573_08175 [Deltaproteobacteria bacterium]|nr:hypothetical protein [Deltaproteobacteria bacterium]